FPPAQIDAVHVGQRADGPRTHACGLCTCDRGGLSFLFLRRCEPAAAGRRRRMMRAGHAGLLPCLLLLAGANPPPADKVQPPPVPPVDSGITMMAAPVAILITSFDADRDRVVTRAEFDAGVKASFALGDANGDGAISLIELSHWAEAELGSAGAL